jgi:hypothetical protein
MPTAAKLFAAFIFAGVAFLAAQLYAGHMADDQPPGLLREISALIGLICGWGIMGPNAKKGSRRLDAMGTGIRTSFTIVVVVLLVFSAHQMMLRAMKGRYDSPVTAILGIFERAFDLVQPVWNTDVIGVLLLGGVLGGYVAHWAGQKWP